MVKDFGNLWCGYLVGATVALLASAGAGKAEGPYGVWVEPGEGLQMQIAPCGYDTERLCGAFLGETLVTALTDLQPAGAGRWIGGQGLDPGDGRVYASRMRVGAGIMQIDYCRGVFCRSLRLTRLPDT